MFSRFAKPSRGDVLEIIGQRIAIGYDELRERVVDFLQANIAALCDLHRAREHALIAVEDLRHLRTSLHKELIAVKLQPVGIVDRLAGLDADHHVLRVRVIFAEVVAVVSRDQRQTEILFELQQVRLNALLVGNALVLNFEIEITFAEDVGEGRGGLASGIVLPFDKILGDLTLQTRREGDQSLRVLGEKFLAHARLVVKAVQRGFGDNLDQVAIAEIVFSENDEMVVAVAFGRSAMIFLLADVKLATENGLDARFFGGVDEGDRAEDVAVVGHGDRGHAELFHASDQALDLAGAVEHGVVGVKVKVDEFRL